MGGTWSTAATLQSLQSMFTMPESATQLTLDVSHRLQRSMQ